MPQQLSMKLHNSLISTDPPYYDNISYADLSDFFYVWLRRSLNNIYPDLFGTMLVPKAQELVVARNNLRDAKKNELKPWLKEQWCIPPKKNAEFVYHMEDILDVYHRLYDARYPQVCMDEGSKQLLSDKRERSR